MEWPAILFGRLKALFGRARLDRELAEEMRFHLEEEAEAQQRAGLSADDAMYAARRQFGNATRLREAGWHAWGWGPLERLWQTGRVAIRSLRRAPGFSISVVLLLAFAIWMNATVFSVIHAVMLAPLPFDHSEQLVGLYETNARKGLPSSPVAPANFADWRASSKAFEEIAAAMSSPDTVRDAGPVGDVDVVVQRVSSSYFAVLRVRPTVGRDFTAEEYSQGAAAIISDALWSALFGRSPDALGATIRFGESSRATVLTIVGVMPASLSAAGASLGKTDVWRPGAFADDGGTLYRTCDVVARLRPGVSASQAQAEMDVIAARLQAKRPTGNAGWGVRVADLREAVPGGYRAALLMLTCAVGLVLLIACANVANLMLARSAARVREFATRAAMGAGRWHLVAQMAAESLFLSLTAAAIGFAMALGSVRALVAFAPPDMPRIHEAAVNLPVFWFCLAVALATGLLCCLAPALRVFRLDLSGALKEGGTSSASAARGIMARTLVVVEVALSLILVAGAMLLAKGFAATQAIKLGFQAENILTVYVHHDNLPRGHGDAVTQRLLRFHEELLPRLRQVPGVVAAAHGEIPPYPADLWFTIVECYPANTVERMGCRTATPSFQYFETLHIPLLKGRFLTEPETAGDAPLVVLNNAAAKLLFPAGEDPIGKQIRLGRPPRLRTETVIGVVGDVPNGGLQRDPEPQLYGPMRRFSPTFGQLIIRTSGDPRAIGPAVRAAIRSVDSNASVRRMETLEDRLARETAGLRFNTLLMTLFAALAFLLAASGVYSLMAYTVTLRTREMSIRMALGADRAGIVSLIVRSGAKLAAAGVVLGLAGALFASRFLASLLFQVKTKDPFAYTAAAALLVLATLTACYIPARRAAGLNVVDTLRQE
jgi:predicted permease